MRCTALYCHVTLRFCCGCRGRRIYRFPAKRETLQIPSIQLFRGCHRQSFNDADFAVTVLEIEEQEGRGGGSEWVEIGDAQGWTEPPCVCKGWTVPYKTKISGLNCNGIAGELLLGQFCSCYPIIWVIQSVVKR